jgi:hypothetical protein
MQVVAYRLWQHWQQMHYPRRGLPMDEAERVMLVTLDGAAGTALDRYFSRGTRARTLDVAARATLGQCLRDLDLAELSEDASRYFERLRQLIELVLTGVGSQSGQPVFRSEPIEVSDSA